MRVIVTAEVRVLSTEHDSNSVVAVVSKVYNVTMTVTIFNKRISDSRY